MPIRTIPDSDANYYLISFDADGRERPEADGSLMSDTVRKVLSDRRVPVTDVFLSSHGWKGDVPAAIEQYDRWMGETVRSAGLETVRRVQPNFKALTIGLHWPSLPWGEEGLPAGGRLLGSDESTLDLDQLDIDKQIESFCASIADTPAAREALRTILTTADADTGGASALPLEMRAAYEDLYAEAGLATGEVNAAPGTDHEQWDPDAIYSEALEEAGGSPMLLGGGGFKDALLMPLRQLSFWKMKDRARRVGESGGHLLLTQLQQAADPKTRFHLMGHSFGCIVVSAAIAGGPSTVPLPRPVDSLFLVQGALSLWAYCPDIPYAPGTAGYFYNCFQEGQVRGPIVTTRSKKDTAVGRLYPKAAGLRRQLVLDAGEFPKYGGIGAFGIQGLADKTRDLPIQAIRQSYNFVPGRIYNLEASDVIRTGGGFSGAHSDIAHPEVAHALWQAVLATF